MACDVDTPTRGVKDAAWRLTWGQYHEHDAEAHWGRQQWVVPVLGSALECQSSTQHTCKITFDWPIAVRPQRGLPQWAGSGGLAIKSLTSYKR